MTCPKGIKICRDCRWNKADFTSKIGDYDKCFSPKNIDGNLCYVSGNSGRKWIYSINAREQDCGLQAARWFEPKIKKARKWWNPFTWRN
jgi:hypothetical protein